MAAQPEDAEQDAQKDRMAKRQSAWKQPLSHRAREHVRHHPSPGQHHEEARDHGQDGPNRQHDDERQQGDRNALADARGRLLGLTGRGTREAEDRKQNAQLKSLDDGNRSRQSFILHGGREDLRDDPAPDQRCNEGRDDHQNRCQSDDAQATDPDFTPVLLAAVADRAAVHSSLLCGE